MPINTNYAGRLRPLAAPVDDPASPQASRFFELPNEISPDGKPTLVPLVTRAETIANFFTVHINQNYDFDGVAPDSFEMLDGSDSFAQHGVLLRDYRADTNTIDTAVRMLIQLDGVDTTIENQNAFAGLASTFLVFVGSEIMSIVGSEMVGDGSYFLSLARGRFGTTPVAHSADDELFIVKQSLMLKLQHPQIQAGNEVELKIAIQANGVSSDLADVTASTATIEGTAFNLPAISALTVNGVSVNASYDPAEAMEIAWVLPVVTGLDMTRAYTLLEFLVADVVIHTLEVAWPTSETTYLYAEAPDDFVLRAKVVVDTDWNTITGQPATLTVYSRTFICAI